MTDPVLKIRDLAVEFRTEIGITHALTGVSFDVGSSRDVAVEEEPFESRAPIA